MVHFDRHVKQKKIDFAKSRFAMIVCDAKRVIFKFVDVCKNSISFSSQVIRFTQQAIV